MMRFLPFLIISGLGMLLSGCAAERERATPLETFKTYAKAVKAKDLTTMKLLVSAETMKMYEQEAKAMGVTVDDIASRETLFNESQTVVKTRNETINGDMATVEVENAFGRWETIPFVREDGDWKIDKKGYADRMMQDIDMHQKQLDDMINQDRIGPAELPSPAY